MLRFIFIISIYIFSTPLFGNIDSVIDSLKGQLLLSQEDSIRVEILNELSWQYRNINYEFAQDFAEQGLELSKKIGYRVGMVDAQNRLGIAFKNSGNYKQALKVYMEALSIEEEAKDTFGIARVYYQIANVYDKMGEYDQALKYLNNSLIKFQQIKDYKNSSKTQNLIGSILLMQSQYKKALSNFLEALEIRNRLLDSVGIASTQLNIGLLYQKMGNYEKSQEYLLSCAVYYKKIDYLKGLAKCYNNIGNNFLYMGNYNEASNSYMESLKLKTYLKDQHSVAYVYLNMGKIAEYRKDFASVINYYKQAEELFKRYENKRGLATVKMNIGSFYNEKQNSGEAISYLKDGLKLSEEINDIFLRIKILDLLSTSYAKQKRFEKAVECSAIYNNLKDSLNGIYKSTMNYKIKYEEEQQKIILAEKDRQIKESKLKRARLVNYFLISGVVVLIIFTVILIIFLKQKHKRIIAEKNLNIKEQRINELLKSSELKSTYAKLEGQDIERKRIARDLHDRLGSTLSTIKLYFGAVESKLDQLVEENREQYNKANQLLDKASDEVHKIAKDMNSGLLTKFGLLAELRDLAETIEQTSKLKVNIIESGFASRLDVVLEGKIYRIIQEIVSNVLKHAKANILNIQITRFNGTLNIIVEDDGIGFDYEKALKKNRLGLKNIESRVSDLAGDLSIDSGKGAGTTISIDINVKNKI